MLPGQIMRRIVSRAMRTMKAGASERNIARLYTLRKIEGGMAFGAMLGLALLPLWPGPLRPLYGFEYLWAGWLETLPHGGPAV